MYTHLSLLIDIKEDHYMLLFEYVWKNIFVDLPISSSLALNLLTSE